jgi:hypothetical protein
LYFTLVSEANTCILYYTLVSKANTCILYYTLVSKAKTCFIIFFNLRWVWTECNPLISVSFKKFVHAWIWHRMHIIYMEVVDTLVSKANTCILYYTLVSKANTCILYSTLVFKANTCILYYTLVSKANICMIYMY